MQFVKYSNNAINDQFEYRIAGFFPEVLIFPNFPNELLAREILFWTADCFKRVYCVITNNSIASNTYVAS